MLPILVHFTFTTPGTQALAYLLAVAVVVYAAVSGWRGAVGAAIEEKGKKRKKDTSPEYAPATQADKAQRALVHGIVGAVIARVALLFMLPATAFLGSKGEGIPLHTYGLFLAAGFLLAVRVSAAIAEREWRLDGELRKNQVLDLAFWVLLGGVGGAHLLYMLVNWRETGAQLAALPQDPSKLVDLLTSGLVFQGGLLGAMAVSYVYAQRHDMSFLRLADVAAPTVSLGSALGRLGCFSAGCCWGDVVPSGHFGLHFPGPTLAKDLFGRIAHTASLAFQSQRSDGRWVVEATGQIFNSPVAGAEKISDWVARHGHTLPVVPTQAIDSFGNLLLFVTMLFARRLRRFHGQVLAMWLMGYAVLRSVVEGFRGDVERGTLRGLLDSIGGVTLADKVPPGAWYNISTGQFISLCMFGLGVAILVRGGRSLRLRPAVLPPRPISA